MSDMTRPEAERIVDEIITDLRGRRGFKGEWVQIETSVQSEIRDTWTRIVLRQEPVPGLHPEERLANALAAYKMTERPVSEVSADLAQALTSWLAHYLASVTLALQGGACLRTPPQFRVPREARGFGFIVRDIGAYRQHARTHPVLPDEQRSQGYILSPD